MDAGFVVLLLGLPVLALLLWQWWGDYLAAPEERRPHHLALPRPRPALGTAARPHRPGSNRRAA